MPGRGRFFNRYASAALLASAVALHFAAALGFLFALPLYDWPDEPAHFNYVRRLAAGRGLTVMGPGVWREAELEELKRTHFRDAEAAREVIAGLDYEAHQPPLYYLFAAAIYRLTGSSTAVKLLNLFLSCVAIVLGWSVGRLVHPDDGRIAVAAAFFLALVPMRCFMAVSIGNDLLAEALFGLFVLAVLSGARPSLAGALVGLGVLAKSSMLVALPLYAVWLAFDVSGADRAAAPRRFAIAAASALVVASPWLARNVVSYGWTDPFALWSGALGRPGAGVPADLLLARRFLFVLFASWWGVFGWMGMFPGRRVLALYALLSFAPLAGAALAVLRKGDRHLFRLPPAGPPLPRTGPSPFLLWWLALAPLTTLAALVLYSVHDFQPQGRYLMLASSCIGVLWATAARDAFGRYLEAWILASTLALAWANVHGFAHVIPWYLAR